LINCWFQTLFLFKKKNHGSGLGSSFTSKMELRVPGLVQKHKVFDFGFEKFSPVSNLVLLIGIEIRIHTC